MSLCQVATSIGLPGDVVPVPEPPTVLLPVPALAPPGALPPVPRRCRIVIGAPPLHATKIATTTATASAK